jgi:AAA domain
MNAPIIRKAQRKKAKLRLAISAPPGAGKTLGALLLAYGILHAAYPDATNEEIWNKIGMIDTEEGSGELYVGVYKHGVMIGEYAYLRISAPFSAVKYLESQRSMEQAGIEVIIHDSLTHAWAGQGGLLDKQGKITDQDKYHNSWAAWRKVTPDHNALVDAILQSPAHIIGTMRSKVEYAQGVGTDGKAKIVKLGLAPIQREGMEYEFTVFFDINDQSQARATKDRTDLFSSVSASGALDKREFMITPAVGAELHKWLNTGVESIDSLAERLAADVAASQDLEATYAAHAGTFARLESERPAWVPLMTELFDKRNVELQNTAKAV